MTAALLAQSRELLGLVALTALTNEVGVRILGRTRLGTLTADDAQPLLREMRAGEIVGQIGGRENEGAVGEGKHQQTSRARGGAICRDRIKSRSAPSDRLDGGADPERLELLGK